MRKLKLDLDNLQVTSFETQASPDPRSGTVFGQHDETDFGVQDAPKPETQNWTCGETYCGDYTCGCNQSEMTFCINPCNYTPTCPVE